MIVFDLVCDNEHRFEGWFVSREDYERQIKEKLVNCPLCGSNKTRKTVTASHIGSGIARRDDPAASERERADHPSQTKRTEALARLMRYVIENTEDVGAVFPEEARKMHYREAPQRQIRGTASTKQVEELKEEGIDVMSLPFPIHGYGKIH